VYFLSFEDVDILRKRAESFLRNALYLIGIGDNNLAMFNLEQYCQLILKYKSLVIKGSYPRTHSLRRLIRELGEFDSRILTLVNDVKNIHYIARLEEAYITSRYLPIEYTSEEVNDIVKFVMEVFKPLVESIRTQSTTVP